MRETLTVSRRTFAAGLAAAGLAGCAQTTSEAGSAASTSTGAALTVHFVEAATSYDDLIGSATEDVQAWIADEVYDTDVQAAVRSELDQAIAAGSYTLEAPLVYRNPFGTNALSFWIHFTTDAACAVTYTVSVTEEAVAAIEDESLSTTAIDDFTRAVDGGAFATAHEFQLIGLVAGALNTITIEGAYEDGTTASFTFEYEVGALLGDEALQLEVSEGSSEVEPASGLYVILGNDSTDADFMYYYDDQGILRSEVPVIGYRSHRMLFDAAGTMYYSASQSKMAAQDPLGQIVGVYHLGDFDLHHDYVWYDDTHILVLATDTSRDDSDEDLVILLDIETGEVRQLVDMGELLPAYKETAFAYHEANYEGDDDGAAGWMHINSLQYLADEDAVLLSSRETSTIFKVGAISTEPVLEYLMASPLFWEGTDYEDLLLEPVGDFLIHGGQHCLTYVEDDALEDGQYYLQFFNNNFGASASVTNDFDYAGAGIGQGSDPSSYYYVYLVDEDAGTFELVDSLAVTYSGYVSSVQWKDGNLIVDSGGKGEFTEFDASYEPIRTFTMGADKFIYRVFKYDL